MYSIYYILLLFLNILRKLFGFFLFGDNYTCLSIECNIICLFYLRPLTVKLSPNIAYTTYEMKLTTCIRAYTTYEMKLTTCIKAYTTYEMKLTTCIMAYTTYEMKLTTCIRAYTTYEVNLQRV